jgi:hypothetical protein
MCFITLFITKNEASEEIEDYEEVMREVATKYVKHFDIKTSKGGKRMTLSNLCEIKKSQNPDEVFQKMISEINQRTNGTAGGWLCKKQID